MLSWSPSHEDGVQRQLLGSRPYSSHFTRSRLATVVPMGSAVRHLIPDKSYVLGHVEFLMQIAVARCFGLGLGFIWGILIPAGSFV